MTNNEYLAKILAAQKLADDSDEMKKLQERRAEVEAAVREHFAKSSPTIRYGGSKAKGTMIKESYDLDIICYFPHDETAAGETLEEIYNNTHDGLAKKYLIEKKASALRLRDPNPSTKGTDYHIDVVPGRFTGSDKSDAFLYQSTGEKKRLKTNLDIHIKHVKESGVTDAIRLMKLWKVRNGVMVKNFALELLTIKLLKDNKGSGFAAQLEHVWKQFRDETGGLSVEDPANPNGNDLSALLSSGVRSELASVASRTLSQIEQSGWEMVFGKIEDKTEEARREGLRKAAASVVAPTKPWSGGT